MPQTFFPESPDLSDQSIPLLVRAILRSTSGSIAYTQAVTSYQRQFRLFQHITDEALNRQDEADKGALLPMNKIR